MTQTAQQNIRELLQGSGIEYLSFSSMKELRNNEMLFFKKYINYEFDNNIWLSTIIGKSCHHGIELFYWEIDNIELYQKDPAFVIDKITKFAMDYAKDEYIAKNQKPEDFWKSNIMIDFGWYEDLRKLVDEYKAQAEAIKGITEETALLEANKELEAIGKKITKNIEKAKEKDAKLDNLINWGATGTIDKIMDGIQAGLKNWFAIVYPKVKDWKLIATEYNRTLDVADLQWEILDLPLKIIIDAVFEDENWDIIIVDWKFKSQLSDDDSIKPDYDMQWSTYFFGGMSALEKMPTKALFIEIQPAEAKPPYMQQAELRELCTKHEIDWEKWNNGKWMTNGLMTDALLECGALELAPVVYEYVIDFTEKPYLLDMWTVFYKQTIKRLVQLLVEEQEFLPNIFDGNFGGWVIAYQEWMAQFMPKDTPEYTEADAVDL